MDNVLEIHNPFQRLTYQDLAIVGKAIQLAIAIRKNLGDAETDLIQLYDGDLQLAEEFKVWMLEPRYKRLVPEDLAESMQNHAQEWAGRVCDELSRFNPDTVGYELFWYEDLA